MTGIDFATTTVVAGMIVGILGAWVASGGGQKLNPARVPRPRR